MNNPKPRHRVRVKGPDLTGGYPEVWIDDFKLRGVTDYVVSRGADTPTRVMVTFYVESVNEQTVEPPT